MKQLLAVVLLLTAGLFGCSAKQPEAPKEEETPAVEDPVLKVEDVEIKEDPVFGSTIAQISEEEFQSLGFAFGDSIGLYFSNGTELADIPYHNGYYSRIGEPVAVHYPGLYGLNFAYNLGSGTWETYGFKDTDTVTIVLNQKGKYLKEQETFAQTHSDLLEDYESPEQFANFRALSGGTLKKNLVYRSASMTNNTMNRADIVDDLAEQYGIKVVLDFSDTDEALAEYRAMDTWNSDYFDRLYEDGKISVLHLGVNPASEEFRTELSAALYKMTKEEGPYLFFCTEGKDRTGYASVLIEALCGATYDELLADYMKTYENYYGMTMEEDYEQCRAAIDTSFDPIMEIMFSKQDGEDIKTMDYAPKARDFLKNGGLTDEQIDEMISVLSEG